MEEQKPDSGSSDASALDGSEWTSDGMPGKANVSAKVVDGLTTSQVVADADGDVTRLGSLTEAPMSSQTSTIPALPIPTLPEPIEEPSIGELSRNQYLSPVSASASSSAAASIPETAPSSSSSPPILSSSETPKHAPTIPLPQVDEVTENQTERANLTQTLETPIFGVEGPSPTMTPTITSTPTPRPEPEPESLSSSSRSKDPVPSTSISIATSSHPTSSSESPITPTSAPTSAVSHASTSTSTSTSASTPGSPSFHSAVQLPSAITVHHVPSFASPDSSASSSTTSGGISTKVPASKSNASPASPNPTTADAGDNSGKNTAKVEDDNAATRASSASDSESESDSQSNPEDPSASAPTTSPLSRIMRSSSISAKIDSRTRSTSFTEDKEERLKALIMKARRVVGGSDVGLTDEDGHDLGGMNRLEGNDDDEEKFRVGLVGGPEKAEITPITDRPAAPSPSGSPSHALPSARRRSHHDHDHEHDLHHLIHDLTSALIDLVSDVRVLSTQNATFKAKQSDLEMNLKIATSNLQLAEMNSEMLEEALRRGGGDGYVFAGRMLPPPSRTPTPMPSRGQGALGIGKSEASSRPGTPVPGDSVRDQEVQPGRASDVSESRPVLQRRKSGSEVTVSSPTELVAVPSPNRGSLTAQRPHLDRRSVSATTTMPISTSSPTMAGTSTYNPSSSPSTSNSTSSSGTFGGFFRRSIDKRPGAIKEMSQSRSSNPAGTVDSGVGVSGDSNLPRISKLTGDSHGASALKQGEQGSHRPGLSINLPTRSSSMTMPKTQNAPTTSTHIEISRLRQTLASAQVTVKDLSLELTEMRNAKSTLEDELENLSQALFEEANKMVSDERKLRAEQEEEAKLARAERDALRETMKLIMSEDGRPLPRTAGTVEAEEEKHDEDQVLKGDDNGDDNATTTSKSRHTETDPLSSTSTLASASASHSQLHSDSGLRNYSSTETIAGKPEYIDEPSFSESAEQKSNDEGKEAWASNDRLNYITSSESSAVPNEDELEALMKRMEEDFGKL